MRAELSERLAQRKVILTILAVAVLSASTMVTARQIKYWQNSMVLFKRVIDVSPDAWYMHSNYGNFLKDEGRVDEAIKHFRTAIEMKPDFAEAYYNMGNAFARLTGLMRRCANYKKAIELKAEICAGASLILGTILAQMGKKRRGVAEFNKVLELKPDDAEAISSIGLLFAEQGQLDEALNITEKRLRLTRGI